METAHCVECATDRKVVENMRGYLVFATCGHVLSIEAAQEREAFVEMLKEIDVYYLLDKFQEAVMESSYQSAKDQDRIFAIRAEIVSRVKVSK
ncbi:hypothetical protein [Nocardia phage P3.1]|nr:hypothetical protein [Nocardia phage P3.1]